MVNVFLKNIFVLLLTVIYAVILTNNILHAITKNLHVAKSNLEANLQSYINGFTRVICFYILENVTY